jgi:hypothetical protein
LTIVSPVGWSGAVGWATDVGAATAAAGAVVPVPFPVSVAGAAADPQATATGIASVNAVNKANLDLLNQELIDISEPPEPFAIGPVPILLINLTTQASKRTT